MEVLKDLSKNLIDIDEDRLNVLMELAKQYYPDVPEYFLHSIAVEQCMIEAGYEPDEKLANELYQLAQESLKKTEYNFKVERE